MAGMYGVYHGSHGLKAISTEIHLLTNMLSEGLKKLGYHQKNTNYFDTLLISIGKINMDNIIAISKKHHINFNVINDDLLSISLDEKDDLDSLREILEVFAVASSHSDYKNLINEVLESGITSSTFDQGLFRESDET
jgi:glycine dehydrogenase